MSEEDVVTRKVSEAPPPRRRPKKVVIPRRVRSVIPEQQVKNITADKTTSEYPKEDPYRKRKKLRACLQSPLLLYELAADVVDSLRYPTALEWSEEDVADWMENVVGFPEYRECILRNNVDGMRLLMLEDPSRLPDMNIHYWEHIKIITNKVREEYSTDFIKFVRSIALPFRRLAVNSSWFKSRTGPSWGIRKNWTRCDILRWMKIIMPEPPHLDHWDLVWYQSPDFPKLKFARQKREISPSKPKEKVASFSPRKFDEPSRDYWIPRRFNIQTDPEEHSQFVKVQHGSSSMLRIKEKKEKKKAKRQPIVMKFHIKKESGLLPKKITTEGLTGADLVLARRKMPKPKFLA